MFGGAQVYNILKGAIYFLYFFFILFSCPGKMPCNILGYIDFSIQKHQNHMFFIIILVHTHTHTASSSFSSVGIFFLQSLHLALYQCDHFYQEIAYTSWVMWKFILFVLDFFLYLRLFVNFWHCSLMIVFFL